MARKVPGAVPADEVLAEEKPEFEIPASVVEEATAKAVAAPVVAPAPPAPPPVQAPAVAYYRVDRELWVMLDGQRVLLRYGKTLDSQNYDIAKLKSQGAVLTDVTP